MSHPEFVHARVDGIEAVNPRFVAAGQSLYACIDVGQPHTAAGYGGRGWVSNRSGYCAAAGLTVRNPSENEGCNQAPDPTMHSSHQSPPAGLSSTGISQITGLR